jgi:hypothetical protein
MCCVETRRGKKDELSAQKEAIKIAASVERHPRQASGALGSEAGRGMVLVPRRINLDRTYAMVCGLCERLRGGRWRRWFLPCAASNRNVPVSVAICI